LEKLIIKGGKKLKGTVKISGAKNASLPILAATILSNGKYYLSNIPQLKDISTMLELLDNLGITSSQIDSETTVLNTENLSLFTAPYELVKTMRASVLTLGPLLAKRKKAKVSMPGGCAIGERPVDQHIKALVQMGADISINHGYIDAKCDKLKGTDIYFDVITVTGTENILMAATLADGKTILNNAAREPEVVDLAHFLKKMGANIEGEGTSTIVIEGVDELKPANYKVMSDRIEAGTFMCAVGITGGEIEIKNTPINTMISVVDKLKEAGLCFDIKDDETVCVKRQNKLVATDLTTTEYPGFPTDMQAQFMSLMVLASGTSVITENIFENRFMHVSELKRMGADITLKDRMAVVKGVNCLNGADVMASDLRASASLVLAGLAAEGTTNVHRIYHLDRGYELFEEKLKLIGADIMRDNDE
jgi:UDP-N-acetylglucosamine 1-carboxyvinyltransferase